jgi:hypothetical protein
MHAKLVAFAVVVVLSQAAWVAGDDGTRLLPDIPRGIVFDRSVDCDEAMYPRPWPSPSGRVLLGRVALAEEGRLLQANYAPDYNWPLPYFAKSGLVVRGGPESVELDVPLAWRDRFAIGWGGGRQASTVRILPCDPSGEWLAYAGGYYVRKPECVPLTVRIGGETAEVRIAVGSPC